MASGYDMNSSHYVVTCTRLVQDQANQPSSIDRREVQKVVPAPKSYWQLMAAGGGDTFLQRCGCR